jgi:hypothetical protein
MLVTRWPAHLLLLLVCFLFPIFAQSQTPAVRANYLTPRSVSFERFARRTFKKYYGPAEYNSLLIEGFYPIGWSRDGKFAYYIEPVDEACGCYFAELIIQDLRTDEIVWHFKNDPDDRVDKEGAPLPDDIRKLWRRNQKTFSDKLREYGIVPASRFVLLPKTFNAGGKSYTAKVSAILGDDPDGLNRIQMVALDLTSPTLENKTLYNAEYQNDEMYVSPLDVAVAGAYKSPFENRAAILLVNVQRGWEGPPHTVNISVVGADLASGFRKSK